MRHWFLISQVSLLLLSLGSVSLHAEQIVITDDGSEVLIKDDGSWVQLSRDRYATNRAGDRIRLKPNGTWDRVVEPGLEPIDQPNEVAATPTSVSDIVAPLQRQAYKLLLDRAEILKVEVKTQKSGALRQERCFTCLSLTALPRRYR